MEKGISNKKGIMLKVAVLHFLFLIPCFILSRLSSPLSYLMGLNWT